MRIRTCTVVLAALVASAGCDDPKKETPRAAPSASAAPPPASSSAAIAPAPPAVDAGPDDPKVVLLVKGLKDCTLKGGQLFAADGLAPCPGWGALVDGVLRIRPDAGPTLVHFLESADEKERAAAGQALELTDAYKTDPSLASRVIAVYEEPSRRPARGATEGPLPRIDFAKSGQWARVAKLFDEDSAFAERQLPHVFDENNATDDTIGAYLMARYPPSGNVEGKKAVLNALAGFLGSSAAKAAEACAFVFDKLVTDLDVAPVAASAYARNPACTEKRDLLFDEIEKHARASSPPRDGVWAAVVFDACDSALAGEKQRARGVALAQKLADPKEGSFTRVRAIEAILRCDPTQRKLVESFLEDKELLVSSRAQGLLDQKELGGGAPALAGPTALELRAGAEAKVKAERPTVNGKLSPEVVQRALHVYERAFRGCYARGLAAHPALGGRVVATFVVGKSGAVTSASTAGGTLADADVTACVTRVVKGLTFPPPDSGTVTVTYPLTFQPK